MSSNGMITRRVGKFIVAAALLAFFGCGEAGADERQYKIEAAYLYSFFNYITWPGYNSSQKLEKPVICVYGNDPILPYLDYVKNKMASERTLTIRNISDVSAAGGCHVLFSRHSALARANIAPDTLLVSKLDDPLDRGGSMIDLSEDGDHIAIRINQSQLEQNGFQVSSRLLELAQGAK
jgi:hypothetical protein